jgi:cell wall-associated NlpC family hydrolase
MSPGNVLGLIVVVIVAVAVAGGKHHHPAKPQAAQVTAARHATRQAATAIAYARAQLGKRYVYGATGPDAFDCSGLVQAAWAAAGVSVERTSEQQWASLPHVTRAQLRPGDLVFEAGGDLALDPWPGHVYLYTGGGKGVEAYAVGYPVRVIHVRWSDAVGFARPGA